MRLRRAALQNVRSFLERREVEFPTKIAIIIGPNGGGKTNLLDTIAVFLRKYLLTSQWAASAPTPENPRRREFRHNDILGQLLVEKHTDGSALPQIVELELEITAPDIESMKEICNSADEMDELIRRRYFGFNYAAFKNWDVENIAVGTVVVCRFVDGNLEPGEMTAHGQQYLQFLKAFEIDKQFREEFGKSQVSIPFVYLPVNRATNPLASSVELTNYDWAEQKRSSDGTTSRQATSLLFLAIGRLAQVYRRLLGEDKGKAKERFLGTPGLKSLTEALKILGYAWNLVEIDAIKNSYDIELTKRGSTFRIGQASSGERELLNYVFSIYALNIRDALIVVDEPELHLHPEWQTKLLAMFERLSKDTGNQFILATHSPRFITPHSIEYVTRIYSDGTQSYVQRLDAAELPNRKHRFNIVNSQNNEKIFFADRILLVEGLSDLIFIESAFRETGIQFQAGIIEIVSVGGKGLFEAYGQLLDALEIKYFLIADFDYLKQVGSPEVRALFNTDFKKIRDDVVFNEKSYDGARLIALMDAAIEGEEWTESRELWNHIKETRVGVLTDLSVPQQAAVAHDLAEQAIGGKFILKKGALEAYLPVDHRSKDIERLITLTSREGYWADLPVDGRLEIEEILNSVCT